MFWQIWQNNRTKEIGLVTPTPDIESWGTCFQKIENVASKHTAMREKEIYEYLSAELRIKYVFNFLLIRPHHQKLNLGNIKAHWKSSVWFLSIEMSHYQNQLDMSTARRRLKSPQSLSGTPAHPTMVTLVNIMVMNGWLTPFSFQVNRLSHSWEKAISNFDLEISTPGSRSWVWSKGKVIQSAQFHINSLCFHFTSIRPTIPETELFLNLTLKHPMSRTWVRSKVEVRYYTQHPTDAFPFRFTSIGPTIPEIWPK